MYAVAPYEADGLMRTISTKLGIDTIMTSDSDAYLFPGVKHVSASFFMQT